MNQRNLFFDKTSPQYSDFAPELGALLHRLDFPLRNIEEVLNKIFSGLDRSASSVANSSRSGSSRKTRIRKKVPKKKVVAKRALRKAA